MLENFNYYLSVRIYKFFGWDLKIPHEPFHEFFERKINKNVYLSGAFLRVAPEYILWTVIYNFFLAAIPVIVYFLTAITLIKINLDLPSLIILGYYLCFVVITNLCHIQAIRNREEVLTYGFIMMEWDKLQRSHTETSFEDKFRNFINKYWSFMVWGPWGLFMTGMPVYDYFINSKSYALPFPLWFPFDTTRPFGFLIGYIFELLSANCICVQIISGIPCFVYACFVLLCEYDLLIESIATLDKDAMFTFQKMHESTLKPPGYQLYEDPEFLFCLRKHFKGIVEHHQTIDRLIRSLNNITDLTFTMLFLMGSLLIAFAAFFLVSDFGDLGLKMTFAGLLFSNLFIIGLICYLGEHIHSKGEKTREALYFTNWYDWPEDMKRTLRIMLAKTLNPPSLTGAYFTIIPNYQAFATVLNGAYSLINLLIALKH